MDYEEIRIDNIFITKTNDDGSPAHWRAMPADIYQVFKDRETGECWVQASAPGDLTITQAIEFIRTHHVLVHDEVLPKKRKDK